MYIKIKERVEGGRKSTVNREGYEVRVL